MKKSSIIFSHTLILFLFSVQLFSQTYIEGELSGTLTESHSPYIVTNHVTIPFSSSLIIEPGVDVLFTGHYKFIVEGKLTAIGNEADSIHFASNNPDSSWWGIRFIDADSTSILKYCIIEDGFAYGDTLEGAGGGIFCSNSDITISNCTIRRNKSSANITAGGGGLCSIKSSPLIVGNVIANNCGYGGAGGGIYLINSDAIIEYNLIENDTCFATGDAGSYTPIGGGLYFGSSTAKVINNLIYGNLGYEGAGVAIGGDEVCEFINNTIVNNKWTGIYPGGVVSYWSPSVFKNNIIGLNGTGQQIIVYYVSSVRENNYISSNITDSTWFVNFGKNDFRIKPNSPFVNGGLEDTTGLLLPAYDLSGNTRVYNGIIDIGAYECTDYYPEITSALEFSFNEDDSVTYTQKEIFDIIEDDLTEDSDLIISFEASQNLNARYDSNGLSVRANINWYGTGEIKMKVKDSTWEIDTTWAVEVLTVNDQPEIISPDSITAFVGIKLNYVINAEDVDHDSLDYAAENVPSWLTQSGKQLEGVPTDSTQDTTFTVIVTDGELGDTLEVFVTIKENTAPIITSAEETEAQVYSLYKYIPTSIDSEAQEITYSFINYPSWLSANDTCITGIPTKENSDTSFTVIASDGGLFDTLEVSIVLNYHNSPPVFVSSDTTYAVNDSLYSYIASAADSENNIITFIFMNYPQWLTAKDSLIEGTTPSDLPLTTSFSVIATDGEFYDTLDVLIINKDKITDIPEINASVPEEYSLEQNYPNPFNPTTKIGYRIINAGHVSLKVYDLLGREVMTLVNETKSAGYYEVEFNGSHLASGIYIYKLTAGKYTDVKKLVLLK